MGHRILTAPGGARPAGGGRAGQRARRGGSGRVIAALAAAGLLATACGSAHAAGPSAAAGAAALQAPSGPAPSGYTPWPEAERDATHTSQASVPGPRGGRVRWKTDLGSPISAGPSVGAHGTIYESSDAGDLYAIDPRTGQVVWTFNAHAAFGPDDVSSTAAVLPDGTILWPGPDHKLFGIAPGGRELWAFETTGVPLSPVIASPTEIYVMTTAGELTAIHVTHVGITIRWIMKLGQQSFGSPVVRPDGVIETTVDNSLIAIRDEGGNARKLWQFTVPQKVEVSAAVASDGTTVLGANDGFEYGISASGQELWKHATGSPSFSSPAVTSSGTAYYGDNRGVLTIANAGTGAVVRSFGAQPRAAASGGSISTAPLVDSAGDVYYGTSGGVIYGYSPSGSRLFAIHTGRAVDSYPALTGVGNLLIGSDNGYLYSIEN
jgi:outer membrane protein assembly factor BamB